MVMLPDLVVGEYWAFAGNICPDPVLLVTVPDLLFIWIVGNVLTD